MSRRGVLRVGLCAVALAGCNAVPGLGDGSKAGPGCDAEALTSLGKEFESMSSWEVSQKVWPGIEKACGEALPPSFVKYFRPWDPEADPRPELSGPADLKKLNEFKVQACPEFNEIMPEAVNLGGVQRANTIFERCDFQRYGVIEAEDAKADYVGGLLVFAFHQWMLDHGVEAEVARPISRALFTQQALGIAVPSVPSDFEMPIAQGPALMAIGGVTISTERIEFAEREVASLGEDGKIGASYVRNSLIMSLYDELSVEADRGKQVAEATGESWDGTLLVVADARTPFATLADVVHTAGRAEYQTVALAAAQPEFGLAGLPFTPGDRGSLRGSGSKARSGIYAMKGPKDAVPQMARNFDPDMAAAAAAADADDNGEDAKKTPYLTLELTNEGFTLKQPGLNDELRDYPWNELEAVRVRAAEVAKASPDADTVVISASPDVPVSRLVEVISTARGPDCRDEGSDCLLTKVTLLRSYAHEYRPDDWGSGDDDDIWGGLTGTEVGEAYGVGGLGLVGTGRGGGTGEGTIGLGNTGLIGKGGGGGTGSGYGRGSGAGFGGNGKKVPKVRQAKAKVDGDLDKDIIRRIVRAHINEVRSCYNKGLADDPEMSGRVAIEFTIGSKGSVTSSEVQSNSLADKDEDASVGSCIAKAVKRWKFPKPRNGGTVDVVYPFNLSPG